MKAMATRFAGEREVMYVSAFSSRPLLNVRQKEAGGRSMAYTFADALAKYGKQLKQEDLGAAYRKAGTAFKGQMQQNFVVLHDTCTPGAAPRFERTAGRGAGGSRGRPQMKNQMKRKMSGEGHGGSATAEKKKK